MEKFPVMSRAPPTSVRTGKEMTSRPVLLDTWTPPPTEVSTGIVRLGSAVLPMNAKLPFLVAKLPTVVKLGAEKLVM